MKKNWKRALAVLLTALLVVGAAPAAGLAGIADVLSVTAAAENSGTYGVLTYQIADGEASITGCDQSASGALIIPDTIEGCPVTSIGVSAVRECVNLSSITIPNSVIIIEQAAFYGCDRLLEIVIPDSVTTIGHWAFRGCGSLTRLSIGKGLSVLGLDGFGNGGNVPFEARGVFGECPLTEIHVAPENRYFHSIDNCLIMDVPFDVVYDDVDHDYFYEQTSNGTGVLLLIPFGTSVIPYDGSFGHIACDDICMSMNMTEFVIPEGIQSIDGRVFMYSWGLQSITIPRSLKYIDYNNFMELQNLPDDMREQLQAAYDEAVAAGESMIWDELPIEAVQNVLNGTYLKDVYYQGSQAEWDKIIIDDGNNGLLNATIHFLDDNATLQVHGDTAVRGQTVQVRVSIDDNPGLIALRMHLQYDPQALTLTAVDNGEVFGASCFNPGGDLANVPFTTLWVDPLSTQNYDTNGTLVTFTFTVAEDAPVGDTPITLEVDAPSTFNMDLQAVGCTVTNGCVHVLSHLPGDADGDGEVTLMDVTAISRFLAGGWDVTINEAAADVNGDAVVDLRDVILIRRFLAGGWDVELI